MKKCIVDKLEETFINQLLEIADFGYVTITNDYEDNCLNIGREEFTNLDNSIVFKSVIGKDYFDIVFSLNQSNKELFKKYINKSILHNWGLIKNDFKFLSVTDKDDISMILDNKLLNENVFKNFIKEETVSNPLNHYINKNETLNIDILNIPNQKELVLSKLEYYRLVKNNKDFKKIQKRLLNIYVFLLLFGFYAIVKTDPLLTIIFILLSIIMLIIIFKSYKKFNKVFIKNKNIKIKKEE